MRIGKKTSKKEKKAMTVSLYGNLFFVILELIMAVATGSQAVLLDAVYAVSYTHLDVYKRQSIYGTNSLFLK